VSKNKHPLGDFEKLLGIWNWKSFGLVARCAEKTTGSRPTPISKCVLAPSCSKINLTSYSPCNLAKNFHDSPDPTQHYWINEPEIAPLKQQLITRRQL